MRLNTVLTGLMSSGMVNVRSRLELAGSDLQLEFRYAINSLLGAVAALLLGGFSVLFGSFALVAVYWETDRVRVLVALSAVFAVVALAIIGSMRRYRTRRPRFMAATLAGLEADQQRAASFIRHLI